MSLIRWLGEKLGLITKRDVETKSRKIVKKDAITIKIKSTKPSRTTAPLASTEKSEALINIGFDFGTSSTKILWRDILNDRVALLGFDGNVPGYSSVCLPSTLKILQNGRLLFGSTAEKDTNSGTIFRSLKVCFACNHNVLTCRNCGPSAQPGRAAQGRFSIQTDRDDDIRVNATELCMLLVAGLMREARSKIVGCLPPKSRIKFINNMAAPLDQLEGHKIREPFERLFYYGTELVDQLDANCTFEEALNLCRQVIKNSLSIPDSQERLTFVVPEAIAAVHAYCKLPQIEDGLYALIDVGAGTTNVSFFRFSHDYPKPVAFYASHTDTIGADDIDIALLTGLKRKYGKIDQTNIPAIRSLLHDIRLAKQQMNDGSLRISPEATLSADEVCAASGPIIEKIWWIYETAFRRAYAKERFTSRWADLNLVFVGGGSLFPGVIERLKRKPDGIVSRIEMKPWNLPPDLRMQKPSGDHELKMGLPLLAVGLGLSYPNIEISDYWMPQEVQPIGPRPVRDREPDDWR